MTIIDDRGEHLMVTIESDARPAVPHQLVPLAEHLNAVCPDLGAPLVRPWSEEPLLLLDHGRPWLVTPVERDPLRREGQTVMPRAQIRRLSVLAQRDLPIRRMAIAHELDTSGPVLGLLPDLADGPRLCTDEVARIVAGPIPVRPGVRRVGRLVNLTASAARRAGNDVGRLLDPIVFGVVATDPPEHGQMCLWLPILAWEW